MGRYTAVKSALAQHQNRGERELTRNRAPAPCSPYASRRVVCLGSGSSPCGSPVCRWEAIAFREHGEPMLAFSSEIFEIDVCNVRAAYLASSTNPSNAVGTAFLGRWELWQSDGCSCSHYSSREAEEDEVLDMHDFCQCSYVVGARS
jgi:hypothetical protein